MKSKISIILSVLMLLVLGGCTYTPTKSNSDIHLDTITYDYAIHVHFSDMNEMNPQYSSYNSGRVNIQGNKANVYDFTRYQHDQEVETVRYSIDDLTSSEYKDLFFAIKDLQENKSTSFNGIPFNVTKEGENVYLESNLDEPVLYHGKYITGVEVEFNLQKDFGGIDVNLDNPYPFSWANDFEKSCSINGVSANYIRNHKTSCYAVFDLSEYQGEEVEIVFKPDEFDEKDFGDSTMYLYESETDTYYVAPKIDGEFHARLTPSQDYYYLLDHCQHHIQCPDDPENTILMYDEFVCYYSGITVTKDLVELTECSKDYDYIYGHWKEEIAKRQEEQKAQWDEWLKTNKLPDKQTCN